MDNRTLLLILAILLIGQTVSGYTWWNNSWFRRTEITITNAGGPIQNVPIRIDLNSQNMDANFWTNVNSSGNDIRITDSNQSVTIPHWTEYLDLTNQKAIIHTIIPNLPNGNRSIYLYWQNATATNTSDNNSVSLEINGCGSITGYNTVKDGGNDWSAGPTHCSNNSVANAQMLYPNTASDYNFPLTYYYTVGGLQRDNASEIIINPANTKTGLSADTNIYLRFDIGESTAKLNKMNGTSCVTVTSVDSSVDANYIVSRGPDGNTILYINNTIRGSCSDPNGTSNGNKYVGILHEGNGTGQINYLLMRPSKSNNEPNKTINPNMDLNDILNQDINGIRVNAISGGNLDIPNGILSTTIDINYDLNLPIGVTVIDYNYYNNGTLITSNQTGGLISTIITTAGNYTITMNILASNGQVYTDNQIITISNTTHIGTIRFNRTNVTGTIAIITTIGTQNEITEFNTGNSTDLNINLGNIPLGITTVLFNNQIDFNQIYQFDNTGTDFLEYVKVLPTSIALVNFRIKNQTTGVLPNALVQVYTKTGTDSNSFILIGQQLSDDIGNALFEVDQNVIRLRVTKSGYLDYDSEYNPNQWMSCILGICSGISTSIIVSMTPDISTVTSDYHVTSSIPSGIFGKQSTAYMLIQGNTTGRFQINTYLNGSTTPSITQTNVGYIFNNTLTLNTDTNYKVIIYEISTGTDVKIAQYDWNYIAQSSLQTDIDNAIDDNNNLIPNSQENKSLILILGFLLILISIIARVLFGNGLQVFLLMSILFSIIVLVPFIILAIFGLLYYFSGIVKVVTE